MITEEKSAVNYIIGSKFSNLAFNCDTLKVNKANKRVNKLTFKKGNKNKFTIYKDKNFVTFLKTNKIIELIN